MDKDSAISILRSRKTIMEAGKYTAKVTSVNPHHRVNARGGDQIAIVNFNIMTPYHAEQATGFFTQGDYQEAVNNNLTASIRENDYCPVKGETVDIIVEEVVTSTGVKGLFVTGPCIPQKAKAPAVFNIDAMIEGLPQGVDILADVTDVKETEVVNYDL